MQKNCFRYIDWPKYLNKDHSPTGTSLRAVVDRGFTQESSRGRHLLREFPLSVTLSIDCFAKENCAPDDDFVARNDGTERATNEILNLMTLANETAMPPGFH